MNLGKFVVSRTDLKSRRYERRKFDILRQIHSKECNIIIMYVDRDTRIRIVCTYICMYVYTTYIRRYT